MADLWLCPTNLVNIKVDCYWRLNIFLFSTRLTIMVHWPQLSVLAIAVPYPPYKYRSQSLLTIYYFSPFPWDYENQEWPRVPDRKISVEGDMLWHNPNRGVSRGLDVKACRPRLISSDLEREVILDSFSRWILTIKGFLLAFLLLFDA